MGQPARSGGQAGARVPGCAAGGERVWLRGLEQGCVRDGVPTWDRLSGSVGGIYLMPLGYENEPSRRGMVAEGKAQSSVRMFKKSEPG